jgi:hypothetical protein
MVQDYFRIFGIGLPRNSLGQIEYPQGTFTDLSGLSDQEKERTIMEKGIAYRTILYCKGHVGLYVGAVGGRPLMMHALWGIYLEAHRGMECTNVVGVSLVSYLDYGKELKTVNKNKLFIKRLSGMRVF